MCWINTYEFVTVQIAAFEFAEIRIALFATDGIATTYNFYSLLGIVTSWTATAVCY